MIQSKWWLRTTLLETIILFTFHSWLIFKSSYLNGLRWLYFIFSTLQVILRGIGYQGTFEMTNEWFCSKKNTNMGLAYTFYLPQIFLLSLHRHYEHNVPFFNNSTFSNLICDYIFISFCFNMIIIVILFFSKATYKSLKILVSFLIILCIILEKGLYIHHFTFQFACIIFSSLTFLLSEYFPDCFSYGEYSIFCQSVVLCGLAITQKVSLNFFVLSRDINIPLVSRISIATFVSILSTIFIYCFIAQVRTKIPQIRGWVFETLCFILSFSVFLHCLKNVLHLYSFKMVFQWFYSLIFSWNINICLIVWWLFVLLLTVIFIASSVHNQPLSYYKVIIYRKFFHFVIALVYIPGVIYNEELLSISSIVLFYFFILSECVRLAEFSIISSYIYRVIKPFLKKNIQYWFIIPNHFLLLMGVSLPLWLNDATYLNFDTPIHSAYKILYLLSGIISVGIGDAVASTVGVIYGYHRIANGRKSYEGMVSSFIVQFLFFAVFFRMISHSLLPARYDFIFLLCSLLCSAIEGLTSQEDNIILPFLSASLFISLAPYD